MAAWYNSTDTTPIAPAPQWLLDACISKKTTIEASGASVTMSKSVAEPMFTKLLKTLSQAVEGSRNDTLNMVSFEAGKLIASGGLEINDALQRITQVAVELGIPPKDVQRTIESGAGAGATKGVTVPAGFTNGVTAPFPTTVQPAAQPEAEWMPEPSTAEQRYDYTHLKRPQIFKDWSSLDISLTIAESGAGKTTLKLQEAICLALGHSFLGLPCSMRGRSMYISGEDTTRKHMSITGKLMESMGLKGDREANRLVDASIYYKTDTDFCLVDKKQNGYLTYNQASLDKILRAMDIIKPTMLIFDPITSFWGFESSLNDMGMAVVKFIQQIKNRFDVNIDIINHVGKLSFGQKDMSQFAGRGGSAIPSHARVIRTLRKLDKKEVVKLKVQGAPKDKKPSLICNVAKFTDGSPLMGKDILIMREINGYLYSRGDIIETTKKQTQEISQNDVLEFVKKCETEGNPASLLVIQGHFKGTFSKESVNISMVTLEHEGQIYESKHPDPLKKRKVYYTK